MDRRQSTQTWKDIRMIPYGRQDITEDDIEAVIGVLRSDFLTQGPKVPEFERAVSCRCGAEYAVAVNSATSALHIALLAMDVGAGDIVWTSPNTFVASANSALYCGASIDFVDIDLRTYNMSVEALAEKLEIAQVQGRLPKVVIPVHIAGQSCDMKKISELATKYGFKIIEDASHAIGGEYCGLPIGNCEFSDITIFSFHPVKIVTTAEGGIAVTNNHKFAEKMKLIRSHGITRDPSKMTKDIDGPWYYEQTELGFNYRMSDLQAALGITQLKRLNSYIIKRHQIADTYNNKLAHLPLILPRQENYTYSSYHLYIIRLDLSKTSSLSHVAVFNAMREREILVNLHYIPVHTHPYYQTLGFKWGDFPNSEEYYRSAISIPIYPALSMDDQNFVIDVLDAILTE